MRASEGGEEERKTPRLLWEPLPDTAYFSAAALEERKDSDSGKLIGHPDCYPGRAFCLRAEAIRLKACADRRCGVFFPLVLRSSLS